MTVVEPPRGTVARGPVPGVAGVLLTGGASRRMGRDKASIVIEGESLAARLGRVLAAVTSPSVEVGPARSGLEHVLEDPPRAGPLAALAAGWKLVSSAGHEGPVLALACDLPLVGEGLLRFIASWPGPSSVVPVVDGHPQPLCARLSAAAMRSCAELFAGGERSLRGLLAREDVELLGADRWGAVAPPAELSDVDDPGDLARLGIVPE